MMHMVSYTLKAERLAEHEALAAAVFVELQTSPPAGLRYAMFRLGDGLDFIHIVSHEEADGSNALTSLASFQAFTAGVKDRCVAPPKRVALTRVGAHGFVGE